MEYEGHNVELTGTPNTVFNLSTSLFYAELKIAQVRRDVLPKHGVRYFFFDVMKEDSPITLQFHSDNSIKSTIAVAFSRCPTLSDPQALLFEEKAQITLTSTGTPSLQKGRYYVAISSLETEPKEYSLYVSSELSFFDYWKPMTFLVAAFPLLIAYILAILWFLMRKGILPCMKINETSCTKLEL